MKWVLGIVAVVLLTAAAAFIYEYRFLFGGITAPARTALIPQTGIDGVVAWAAKQDVPPGKVKQLGLPASLAPLTTDGYVRVALLKDGRTCVLMIAVWEYKDNFHGVLACNAPLRSDEVVSSDNYPGKTYLSLPGYGVFEELYVESKRTPNAYNVYFDLN